MTRHAVASFRVQEKHHPCRRGGFVKEEGRLQGHWKTEILVIDFREKRGEEGREFFARGWALGKTEARRENCKCRGKSKGGRIKSKSS